MKSIHSIAMAVALAALIASAPAEAQRRGHYRGGVHFGIGIALPLYPYHPYYYPPYYPPYYYPPVTVVPPAPPVYIERQDSPQARADSGQNDWFYCPESKTYYPYVQQCAGEWQRVTPHPPAR
ncbi:MAG: hypothetical protein A3H35_10335 [Betaproteobacteria bacterium RIFCSPLOWO2_02_FULL_62_17]|nr:MAG: hypothetical protein A3H35_10335 [Betaproteobacteria bacterium RIFCSPLOWO2_02_FULL_62_17]